MRWENVRTFLLLLLLLIYANKFELYGQIGRIEWKWVQIDVCANQPLADQAKHPSLFLSARLHMQWQQPNTHFYCGPYPICLYVQRLKLYLLVMQLLKLKLKLIPCKRRSLRRMHLLNSFWARFRCDDFTFWLFFQNIIFGVVVADSCAIDNDNLIDTNTNRPWYQSSNTKNAFFSAKCHICDCAQWVKYMGRDRNSDSYL